MEQELLTLPEHVISPPFLVGFVLLVLQFYVYVVCPFSFGHCVVCTYSIYRFALPLWYLQTPFTTVSGMSILYCLCCILLLYSLTLISISYSDLHFQHYPPFFSVQ